jgi:ABC-type branched-subunit amino acid transport system ATPase component
MPVAVRLHGISKRFGAVQANREVSLSVAAGSVHGLVGENGAGKSTLMAILYGYYLADAGHIEVNGQPARIANSHEAIALGIGMVHQHFMLVDTLSCLENVMLGAEGGFFLGAAKRLVRAELQRLMAETGLQVDLDALAGDLPVGELQRLEILKALYRGARILILDEPTAVLTPQETDQLFVTLRALRERNQLDTSKVDDVVLGCVEPVGEQGADIARVAALYADYAITADAALPGSGRDVSLHDTSAVLGGTVGSGDSLAVGRSATAYTYAKSTAVGQAAKAGSGAGGEATSTGYAAQASDPIMVCGVHLEHVQRVSGCAPSFLAERWRGLRRAGQALGSDDSLTLLIAAGLRLGRGEELVRVTP